MRKDVVEERIKLKWYMKRESEMRTTKILAFLILLLIMNVHSQGSTNNSSWKDKPPPAIESGQSRPVDSVIFDVKHGVSMPNGEPGYTLLMSGMKPNTEIMITAIDTTGARIEMIPEKDPIYADQNGEMIIDVHYGVKGMTPGACLFIVILDKAEIHQFTAEMPIVIPPTEAKKKWTLKFQD
jgi:hypothetical protein